MRKASLDWGPPRGTLEGRIKGHVSRSEGAAPLQRLSPIQEQRLTDWVLVQESLGLSPTHMQTRVFAGRIGSPAGWAITWQKVDGWFSPPESCS